MKRTYLLKGLDCANCAAKMERKVSAIDGVTAAHVNFLTTKMTLEGEEARMDELARMAEAAVKSVDPDVEVKRIG